MARTVVLGFEKLEDAQVAANNFRDDHKVLLINGTDQVLLARGDEDGKVWRSGPGSDLFVVIATKDPIEGP